MARVYDAYQRVEAEVRPMAPVIVAVGIWLGGVVMTRQFLADTWPGYVAPLELWGWALLVQLALSILQSPVWNRAGAGWLNWLALITDTLINAAPLAAWTAGIPTTGVWMLITSILPDSIAPAADGPIVTWGLALILGAIVAYAPERLLFGQPGRARMAR